jgi:hypothetical protein
MSGLMDKIRGCDAVNEHISKPIPTTLWHYTSYAGFQRIVTSKVIWATEYRFLNDREEFLHAKKLAERLVQKEPEFVGQKFPARAMLEKAVDGAFNTGHLKESRLRLMVASFSEEGDQLSQWRGYADNSRGLSIGFDLRDLRPPPEADTAVTFAPCIYRDSEKCALLKAVFADYRNRLESWWNSIMDMARKSHPQSGAGDMSHAFGQRLVSEHAAELTQVIDHAFANLQFDMLRTAPLLKDEGFLEEREWRLVLPQEAVTLPSNYPIEFRAGRDTLIPYISYPLLRPNQDGPVFCRDLILGPGSHISAETAVNLFLRKHGITTLARPSRIPYRPT